MPGALKPVRDTRLNPVIALLLCSAAGALFAGIGTPLPWMLGPLVVMAAFNMSGAALRAPSAARHAGQLMIGTSLGLYFTPAVAREVASYWPVLVAAALLAIGVGAASGVVLRALTGVDRATAYFASVPGGAAEMAVMGERAGARVDRVAVAQSMRIMIVVLLVPTVLTFAGVHGADVYRQVDVPFDWLRLLILLSMAAGVGAFAAWRRLANPFMLGPLFLVVLLTANEIRFSSMPPLLVNAGQLLLGCALGSRFERRFLSGMGRYLVGTIASVLFAILVSAIAAALFARFEDLPVPSLILSMAPGGIAEMCITAKVLQLGVPLVTAAHVMRVLILVTMSGWIYRVATRARS